MVLPYLYGKNLIDEGMCHGGEDGACPRSHISSEPLKEVRTVYGHELELLRNQIKS